MTKQADTENRKKSIDEAETNVDFDTEKVKSNTKTEVERLNPGDRMIKKISWLASFD